MGKERMVTHETKIENASLKTVLDMVEHWYRTHTEKDYALNHLICEHPDTITLFCDVNDFTLTAYKKSK